MRLRLVGVEITLDTATTYLQPTLVSLLPRVYRFFLHHFLLMGQDIQLLAI